MGGSLLLGIFFFRFPLVEPLLTMFLYIYYDNAMCEDILESKEASDSRLLH